MKYRNLEQDLIKELLVYDEHTGRFTWRINVGTRGRIGSVAGSKDTIGYTGIGLNGNRYLAHRLAWVYMYGEIPEGLQVDHINGDREDNRLVNLRLATPMQQTQNVTKYKNNTSGYVGVHWDKSNNKWVSRVWVNYIMHYLGLFDSIEEAIDARVKAKNRLHTFNPVQRNT